MGFDVAKRTGQLRDTRKLIKEKKEEFEQKIAPLVELEEMLKGEIFQFLMDTNQQNAKTVNGTVYKIQKITYPLEDVVEFKRHVIGSEAWDLLDWRANKTACDTFRLQHGGELKDGILIGGDLPPGARKNEIITLGVKAPTKPKTTSKTNVVELNSDDNNDVETL